MSLTPSVARNQFYSTETHLANILGLPPIRGTWFFVDPLTGSAANDGLTPATAVEGLWTAYGLCTTNVGDGICILSADATTYANTTSYINSALTWSKNSITVFGVCAPTRMAQRARIENKIVTTGAVTTIAFASATTITDVTNANFITLGFRVGDIIQYHDTAGSNQSQGAIITAVTATTITCAASTFTPESAAVAGSTYVRTYCASMIILSGSNNSFYNLHFTNLDTNALAVNCIKVTGNRNYFQNVHAGVGVADANTTITYSLWLSAAVENTFQGCTFGLDTVDRGGVATYDILLSGAVARNRFFDCETVRQSSTGTGCLAVYASTTTGGRPTVFVHCRFTIWNTGGGNANCSYMGGSTGACDRIWLIGCVWPGYADMSNDAVFYTSSTYSANENVGLFYT